MKISVAGRRRRAAVLVVAVALVWACGSLARPGIARADSNCAITQDHSITGDTPSTIEFSNASGATVDIYWLDYVGQRVFYNTLADGQGYQQETWLTHPWVAIDQENGACLGYTLSDVLDKSYEVQPPSGPLNLSPPVVTGSPALGYPLSALQGTYDDVITSRTYQWDRCPAGAGSCEAIPGATLSTYRVQVADAGSSLRVQETATNFLGQTTVTPSELAGQVAALPKPGLVYFGRAALSDGNPPSSIFSMGPDGSGQARVMPPNISDFSPVPSPDGTLIAFTRFDGNQNHVWVANADGSGQRQLVGGAFSSGDPAWSPDGQSVAFDANVSGTQEIYTAPVDADATTEPFQITFDQTNDVDPTWSPDGSTILYTRCPSFEGNCILASINSNGDGGFLNLDRAGTDPAYSPDGSQVAFVGSNNDIWLVSPDGSGAVDITNSDASEQAPAWAPDGSAIAYASNAGGHFSIYVQPPAPQTFATQLTNDPTNADRAPSWAAEVPHADLQVSLACTTHCPATPGQQIVFTGAVTNAGPDITTGVPRVALSSSTAQYSFDSVTVDGAPCPIDGPSFCSPVTLAPGASLAIAVRATVNSAPAFPAVLHATLSVTSDLPDPVGANNSVTADAVIVSPAVASNVSVTVKPNTSEPGAREIPTANIDLSALPTTPGSTASAPIASIPIASIPIASIPIASIPIASIGLTPALLDVVGGVPLSSIPLSTTGGWDARLQGTPLAGSLLQVTTLADVLRQAPQVLTGLTLKDVGLASSPIASIPIASIALGPLRLSDLPLLGNTGAQNLTDWCSALAAAGFTCSGGVLGDGSGVGAATMASIGIEGAPIASIPIASIPIASIPIASIPIASIPIASIAVAGSPIASIPIASIAVAGSPIASIPIASIPIASIPTIVDCSGGYPCASKTLGDALIDHRILPGATLSDLGNAILSSLTLGQLAPFFPPNITLGDLLAILAGPSSDRGYELLPFTQLPAQDWASAGGSAIYHVGFSLTGGPSPGGATVNLTLPPGYRYGGGATLLDFNPTGAFTSSTPAPPVVTATALSFHLDNLVPGDTFRLDLTLRPSLILGDAGPATATVTPDNGGTPASGSGGDLIVHDTFEPADDDPANAPTLSADTVYLSYITSATDLDSFRFPAPPAGSRVTVKMVPPQGSDYDLALYRPTRSSVVSSPIASIPLDGQPVPDNGVPLTHATSSLAPETLADIPIASIPIASISDTRGSAEEVATAVTQPGDAGQFLRIDVSGYQGSTSAKPYTLLVTVTPPPDLGTCAPSPIVTTGLSPLGTLPAATSTPTALNTLFVVDSRRLQAAYGPAAAQSVMASLATLAGRADLGVTGAVLDVANDASVRAAEATWDASPCSPDNANAVASAVSSVVTRYTTVRAGAKYIVLVGGDDQIPFFRLPDLATVSNESDYASTFLDHPNEYFGSLASGDVLSDNPYGTPRPTPFFDRYLYVPSLSVGRLVETPTDIVKAVNQFISSAGTLAPSTALVTGYDFLADGSQQVAATETTQRTAVNVKTLIDDPASGSTSPPWSASSLDTALGTAPASVLSLNAHYDHYRLLPSDRGTLFNSSQMAAKSLTGRFVFTMGCHAGLSVSDIIVGASDSRHLDWAQVYGAGGALFAGNTGFGYGDTTGVAYSEKLMALLAKRLDGSLSAGDALTFAKNDFKASLGPIDVYDEKVISETTFYGLPMYRVGPAAALPPVPAPRPTAPDPDGRRWGPDGGSERLADADTAHVAVRVVLLLGRHRVDELPPRRAQHVHRRHGAEPRRPRRTRDPARIDGHPELRRCLLDAHDRPDGDGSRAGLRRLRLPDEDPDGRDLRRPARAAAAPRARRRAVRRRPVARARPRAPAELHADRCARLLRAAGGNGLHPGPVRARAGGPDRHAGGLLGARVRRRRHRREARGRRLPRRGELEVRRPAAVRLRPDAVDRRRAERDSRPGVLRPGGRRRGQRVGDELQGPLLPRAAAADPDWRPRMELRRDAGAERLVHERRDRDRHGAGRHHARPRRRTVRRRLPARSRG